MESLDLKMSFILIWNFLAGYGYQSGLNGNPVEAMNACWQQWLCHVGSHFAFLSFPYKLPTQGF
jgi:hypothetical protein